MRRRMRRRKMRRRRKERRRNLRRRNERRRTARRTKRDGEQDEKGESRRRREHPQRKIGTRSHAPVHKHARSSELISALLRVPS